MARPRKQPASRRTAWISYRVTPDEKAQIQAQAEKAGFSIGDYSRQAVKKTRLVIKESAADFERVDQLRRVGVNLNQIARALNAGGTLPPYLERLCTRIETLLDRLFDEALNHGSPRR